MDLFDAWETAINDWRGDTDEVRSTYKATTLHYDAFRDSVFEIIDLHTTTTKASQYIGYLKLLVSEVTTKDQRGLHVLQCLERALIIWSPCIS